VLQFEWQGLLLLLEPQMDLRWLHERFHPLLLLLPWVQMIQLLLVVQELQQLAPVRGI
jgi:hypothetical protein